MILRKSRIFILRFITICLVNINIPKVFIIMKIWNRLICYFYLLLSRYHTCIWVVLVCKEFLLCFINFNVRSIIGFSLFILYHRNFGLFLSVIFCLVWIDVKCMLILKQCIWLNFVFNWFLWSRLWINNLIDRNWRLYLF